MWYSLFQYDKTMRKITLRGWAVLNDMGEKKQVDITIETQKKGKGTILEISDIHKRSSNYNGVPIHELKDSQILFPGLIDLHTHLPYNYSSVLPAISDREPIFDERHDWQKFAIPFRYRNASENEIKEASVPIEKMEEAHKDIKKSVDSEALQYYCQVGALLGGTTTIQDNDRYNEKGENRNIHLILRSTGVSGDILTNKIKRKGKKRKIITSVIRFFSPDIKRLRTGDKRIPVTSTLLDTFLTKAKNQTVEVLLVHLAEGKSASSLQKKEAKPNDYARQEFLAFKEIYLKNKDILKNINIGLIHCSGIKNMEDLDFLKKNGIFIIWSPISNLLLYPSTLDVKTLLEKEIPLILSSDWNPVGSKHVWDEAQNILEYFTKKVGLNPIEAKKELFKMITTTPAQLLNQSNRLGILKKGSLADFFVLDTGKKITKKEHALDLFFNASDKHTVAVFVGGEMMFYHKKEFPLRVNNTPFQKVFSNDSNRLVKKVKGTKPTIIGMRKKINTILKSKGMPMPQSTLGVFTDKDYQQRMNTVRKRLREKDSEKQPRTKIRRR